MKNLNPAFMKNGEASIAKVSLMMNHMSFHLYKNNQRGQATTVHVTKQKKSDLTNLKKSLYQSVSLKNSEYRTHFRSSLWLLKHCYASAACSIIVGPSWMGLERLRDEGLSQGPLTPVSSWNSDGVPHSLQYTGMSDTPSGQCLP